MGDNDIIVAAASPTGGAIAIVRLSGSGSIEIAARMFRGADLLAAKGQTLHYGHIVDGEQVVDDVLLSLFRAPHSYTAEDSIEISCHGSAYITQQIINLALRHGARPARAGEFTLRAYLAGKMDLSQAEAVAEIIASSSAASHAMASTQMRGGYSAALGELRAELKRLAMLLELELDFSEEDVEFADRKELLDLIDKISNEIATLKHSFAVGNALKNGVAVAIIGEPNVGKSTLLNRLLREDRAMVSNIAGTTRDVIEEQLVFDGITFRFIDTAGIHSTDDELELMGIDRSRNAATNAHIIMLLCDISRDDYGLSALANIELNEGQEIIFVVNKMDTIGDKNSPLIDDFNQKLSSLRATAGDEKMVKVVNISAKDNFGIETLLATLSSCIDTEAIFNGSPIVSSTRHYSHLSAALEALTASRTAIQTALPTDLLSEDIRQAIHHIGEITGEITTNEVLGDIFAGFCIGK